MGSVMGLSISAAARTRKDMAKLARRRALQFAGAAAATLLAPRGFAQSYPVRPVRVIVPFAPGGVTDVAARLVAAKLSERLGRQFYVENLAGGSGNIGMGQGAKAAPDGYTILAAYSSFVVNPALFDRVPYDPVKDFAPVSLAVTSATVLVVTPSVPAKSVKELVALIRANPGKFSYASAGAGTMSHLAGEQFRLALDLDLVHVPFNGGAPSIGSVVGGHTPVGLGSPTAAEALIRDGRLRALAVTGKTRTATLPDVPTMEEAGYPDIEGESFVGFVVPAKTPPDIVALLNREIVKTIAEPETRERLIALGDDPVGSTAEEFAGRIRSELALWDRVIRAANIKPQ
jgi:tripartite-type tricarboxylate transporter receptor subunit TctC